MDDVEAMGDGERLAYLAADLGDLALVDGAALAEWRSSDRMPRTYSMTM